VAFKYDAVVPWGRSFAEYQRMFNLTADELNLDIIGCGDGPASFNATMHQQGRRVISCDPLYQLTAEQIQARIAATYESVIGQTRQNQERFVWDFIKSPAELGGIRLAAMHDFLADYESGQQNGRYVAAQLPHLPFKDASFDLALCSHFLFLYSDNLSLDFHHQALTEMCRVAREVRVFPILNYNAEPSPFVRPLIMAVAEAGYQVEIVRVPYEFQRNGNEMLKITLN
jgi:hypothetical protein